MFLINLTLSPCFPFLSVICTLWPRYSYLTHISDTLCTKIQAEKEMARNGEKRKRERVRERMSAAEPKFV